MKKISATALLAFVVLFGGTNVQAQSSGVTLNQDLSVGATDATTNGQVSALQSFLLSIGYLNTTVTGYFGTLTAAAVKQYQSANAILPVSGYVGSQTRVALNSEPKIPGAVVSSTSSPIKVTAPNGGETLKVGQTYPITWTGLKVTVSNTPIQLLLSYQQQGRVVEDILASELPFSGSYAWTIPSKYFKQCPAGSLCGNDIAVDKFKIKATNTDSYSDYSDNYFTITSATSTPESIKVTTPNGGETFKVGQSYSLSWTSSHVSSDSERVGLKLSYYQQGQFKEDTILSNLPLTGSYRWNVPATYFKQCPAGSLCGNDIAVDKFKLKAYLYSANSVSNSEITQDYSDNYFTIASSPLAITSPDGSEKLNSGGLIKVSLENLLSSGITYAVDLISSQGVVSLGTMHTNNASFQLPTTLQTASDYVVRITPSCSYSNAVECHQLNSNKFTITNASSPITITDAFKSETPSAGFLIERYNVTFLPTNKNAKSFQFSVNCNVNQTNNTMAVIDDTNVCGKTFKIKSGFNKESTILFKIRHTGISPVNVRINAQALDGSGKSLGSAEHVIAFAG